MTLARRGERSLLASHGKRGIEPVKTLREQLDSPDARSAAPSSDRPTDRSMAARSAEAASSAGAAAVPKKPSKKTAASKKQTPPKTPPRKSATDKKTKRKSARGPARARRKSSSFDAVVDAGDLLLGSNACVVAGTVGLFALAWSAVR